MDAFLRCLDARLQTVPTNGFAPRLVPGKTVDAQQIAPHPFGCVPAGRRFPLPPGSFQPKEEA